MLTNASMADPEGAVATVAERTARLAFRVWGFGEGLALLGLVHADRVLGNARYSTVVAEAVEPFLARVLELDDHVASVEVLLALEALDGSGRHEAKARAWAELILSAPRPISGGLQAFRPDLFALSRVFWVDTMHTHGPGLAALGHEDEALSFMAAAGRRLQASGGLFSHGFDLLDEVVNGVHWGRGCGWALLGLVGTLRFADNDELRERTNRLLEALAGHEEDGRWHTVVDDASTPLEHSVSALVALGVYEGIRVGTVNRRYFLLAERAIGAALAALRNGGLPVSEATPVGDVRTYASRRTGIFAWGQGPLLMALVARHALIAPGGKQL